MEASGADGRLYLAKDVHAVVIDEDVVLLDASTDMYFCITDGARHLAFTPSGDVLARDPSALDDLVEAGLLSPRSTVRPSLPPRPTRSMWPPRATASVGPRLLAALQATFRARRGLADLSFLDLIGSGTPSTPIASVSDLSADLAGFERLRPWLPIDGECLSRSYHLRLFLRARGHDPRWVFGVRVWPFMAHCWLQVGDMALDDDLERLVAYHPIMAA
ncbi:lasso peptide biosynthesis B2 protein [Caulobacter sp. SSI4214]|uniref:lasso peptide biosynthesis B2 protein n=1 Tax=Caulobacter sp. SSI4214 TaxID=2575739 RepID=UPI00143B7AE5|nr:lasso peptide biosynthesis B2 protein [Caulobacter sp. SSI4214]